MANTKDIAWLAGFLEGEGCFYFSVNACRVQVVQKDPWPLLRMQQIVGGKITQVRGGCKNTLIYALFIVGRRAVGIMLTIYPLMSPRRQQKIMANLAQWKLIRLKTALKNTTHCRHGHEYTPETTYFHPTKHKRECRICVAASQERYLAKKKLKVV